MSFLSSLVVLNADAPHTNRREQSAVKNVFIRGSVVRYVHLPASAVDIPLLEDATRRGELTPLSARLGQTVSGLIVATEAANQAAKAK